MIARFALDKRGTTSVEYAVLCGLITVIFIAALGSMGDSLDEIFTAAKDALTANNEPPADG